MTLIMKKIAIDNKVYDVFDISSHAYSNTPRGALYRRLDDDFKDYSITKIEFVVNRDEVGVVIIPNAIKDLMEYVDLAESEGKVTAFKLNGFSVRSTTDEEKMLIDELIESNKPNKIPNLRIV